MFAGAVLPLLAALLVVVLVPRDAVAAVHFPKSESQRKPRAFWRTLQRQFYLAMLIYFLLMAFDQLVRLSAPIALQQLAGREDVKGLVGLAFTAAGVAAVAGVVLIGQRFVTAGRLRTTLILGTMASAGAYLVLAVARVPSSFIAAFALLALLQATMVPATNALIAGNVSRERRGTAFGIAGSAQALSFLVGPMAAAGFAATSLSLGYVVLALLLLLLCALLFMRLREPSGIEGTS